jgi:hypothetical protein
VRGGSSLGRSGGRVHGRARQLWPRLARVAKRRGGHDGSSQVGGWIDLAGGGTGGCLVRPAGKERDELRRGQARRDPRRMRGQVELRGVRG